MRFEAKKKKALAQAASTVQAITKALSAASGGGADVIILSATEKSFRLRTVSGAQVVEASVSDVDVEEAGEIAVSMDHLASALSTSGDTFKAILDAQYVNFASGRTKGRIQIKEMPDAAEKAQPKTSLTVPGLKALFQAISLKAPSSGSTDRTLHIDGVAKVVRGEATDSFRGVSVTALMNESTVSKALASISLPSKVLDTIASMLTSEAAIGFDDRLFTIRAPGLYVCMPQSSSAALAVDQQLKDWLGAQEHIATYTIQISELQTALSDALKLSNNSDTKLSLVFKKGEGEVVGESDAGKVNAAFAIDEGDVACEASVVPQFVQECLAFYKASPTLKIKVYTQAVVMNLPEAGGEIIVQTTAIPTLAPVTMKAAKVKPAAAKPEAPAKKTAPAKKPAPAPEPEAEEEAEEEAAPTPPPKPAAAKTKPKPPPVAVEPPPEEEEEEEEATPPPKPAAKPAAKPKPAPVVEPEEEEEVDDADADPDEVEADDEEFDDEE